MYLSLIKFINRLCNLIKSFSDINTYYRHTLCKFLYFLCNYSKSLTCFACSCSLYTCIKGKYLLFMSK